MSINWCGFVSVNPFYGVVQRLTYALEGTLKKKTGSVWAWDFSDVRDTNSVLSIGLLGFLLGEHENISIPVVILFVG